ncbi:MULTISPECIES: trehalose-phosphatase [Aminobacterium]|jgi:trehalose-phosphatase|uniref:trehalose-phosphatase n=1 Tax=Aminobacterium TaxID=81466 RepID=UPI00257C0CA7|nr:trehalose-phosphatase [Aminobacterium sp. UBA4987]
MKLSKVKSNNNSKKEQKVHKVPEERGIHSNVLPMKAPAVGVELSDNAQPMEKIPSAMGIVEFVEKRLQNSSLFITLDYDGTLAPIVDRPELTVFSSEMKHALKKLAMRFPVAVISGRDLKEIKDLIKLDIVVFAGSHGFDILSPHGEISYQVGKEYLPILDRAQKFLEEKFKDIEGALLERKKFSLALHYRLVPSDRVKEVEFLVDRVLAREPKLKKGLGKMVLELKPNLDWDKGKAIIWLVKAIGLNIERTLLLYIGDDITDEDAFKAIRHTGLGIVVKDGEKERKSLAEYSLENTLEVRDFLEKLAKLSSKNKKHDDLER